MLDIYTKILLHSWIVVTGFYFIYWFVSPTDFTSFLDYHHWMILLHSMVFSIIGFYFIRGSSSLNDFDFIIWFVAPTDFTSFLDYHHKILLHLLVCRNLGFYFILESSSLIFLLHSWIIITYRFYLFLDHLFFTSFIGFVVLLDLISFIGL